MNSKFLKPVKLSEYMLLVARIDQSALVIDELITVNQGYLGEYEV